MEIAAFGGQATPVLQNATGFNRWKFTGSKSEICNRTRNYFAWNVVMENEKN